ncbi:MAG: hypothetical protein CL908_14755 [Deltaproteobacteria bacterium]|nr:hypothetical protein [Deltaproteobacteria bacterium]
MVLFDSLPHDLRVLQPGTPRQEIVDELGPPWRILEDSSCPEATAFHEGFTIGERAWKAPSSLFLTAATFGSAEFRLLPVVSARRTAYLGLLVFYDEERVVQTACVYQGYSLIDGRSDAPRRCEDYELIVAGCVEGDAYGPGG